MMPCLSITKIALSVKPSALFTPYFPATLPRGLKSLKRGNEIPPRLSDHAFRQGTWSTLIPRTWAFNPANLPSSASYDGIWFVQTGVHASGKKASTTAVFPRKERNVTSLSRWLGRVKSGAFCPTDSFMVTLLIVFLFCIYC